MKTFHKQGSIEKLKLFHKLIYVLYLISINHIAIASCLSSCFKHIKKKVFKIPKVVIPFC